MEMDFSDFLSKMGEETNRRKRRHEPTPEPVQEYRTPKKERRPAPEPIIEERIDDDFTIPEETQMPQSRIDEEFMDKAYDYAQGVIKVIRQNFKSTEERVAMLESLNHAIGYYLQSVGAQPFAPIMRESKSKSQHDAGIWGGATMSESEWDNMPRTSSERVPGAIGMNDLTGSSVDIQRETISATGDYRPDLKLGIKIAPDGKQEADLSAVTQTDINEMLVLSGMVGPEADAKQRELNAAKQAVAQEMADKQNQPEPELK